VGAVEGGTAREGWWQTCRAEKEDRGARGAERVAIVDVGAIVEAALRFAHGNAIGGTIFFPSVGGFNC
jgi:hypothetical protein